ncbi:hypothetical protein [Nocardia sp. CA-119907]|uniref:hypothetical protein n=1 Tax=Nocardia sp. CA-119907 TaxID=3239973 RepID=UPI003D95C909
MISLASIGRQQPVSEDWGSMGRQDSQSKACGGGCSWVELQPFQLEMARLDETEPVAAGYYRRLMKRAEGAGLGEEEYDAPMGLRLPRKNKPWIAEFKTVDSADKLDIRLYWGEAPIDQVSLVACLIGSKRRRSAADLVRQNSHITKAMDALQRWCNKEGHTCRKLR